MSFQPFDSKTGKPDGLDGLKPTTTVPTTPPAAAPSAAGLALSAAGLAGVDGKKLAVAGVAMQAASALQAGAGAGALVNAGASLAAQANPDVAKAMQFAGQAQALMNAPGGAPGALAGKIPHMPFVSDAAGPGDELAQQMKLSIAEHPLAGQAINDFAVAEPSFTPAAIDPAALADPATASGGGGGGGSADFVDGTRLLRFYSPIKGLLIESMSGTTTVSEQYVFHLSLISKDGSIELKSLMGKNVSVGVQMGDGSESYINGYVNSFGFSHSDGGFAFYHAEIVPWLTFLKRRVNSRIFQDLNVLGVLDKIYKGDHGGLATYEFRTSKSYPPENYIVQYDETDEHFTCRLMEKYGLFYYFEHSAGGHVMVISDDSCNSGFCPPQKGHAVVKFNAGNRVHAEDAVTAFTAERMVQSTKMALNTFNFKEPNTMQLVEQPTVAEQGDVPKMEVYDGNPAFFYKNKGDGKQEAKQRLEVLEWQAKIFTGTSDCRGFAAGHTFKLMDHHWFEEGGDDNDFMVLSVQYSARNNYFERGASDVYRNSFSAIRRKIPYRPRQAHHRPNMPGPQTATVVGPKGTEIHTDKFGRIKVQFHWDRYGRRDELSSCWIRVSQPWAGKNWGTISVPRIGQEVIIDYLEGDPDRPICTGRVYNDDQPVPYDLPAGAHMMGFKSRSTPGGGGFCEMVIHDQKGKELINIHSQKDMVTTVQNNQDNIVHGPHQTNTVSKGFHVTKVKQHIETTAETAHIHDTAKTNIEVTAQTEHVHVKGKTNVELTAETEHIHLKANTDITLEVGSSKIVLKADGTITIQGVHVNVIGSNKIDLNS
ncbi:type VI secretion system tip protein VgrG [Massilia antarctica]|uniref:Type VI secretion system tip protein VgrG n=1 Tax=Massilia antarctica TaxID=2765360 RepID=A0AA48WA23_9BURK|nr:type VI secretion system tip protein TssI/VgrG [Massilia antarctica]QPI48780.1 type VI secretion system tip protein VgrG [Massilia antarctica]